MSSDATQARFLPCTLQSYAVLRSDFDHLILETAFEHVTVVRDEATRCFALLAVHDTRRGPAFGGIRRHRYASPTHALADVLRLAQAMTLKAAVAGIRGGGGKIVLLDRPDLDRPGAYRRIGAAVEMLGGRLYTGPDAGTEDRDLEEVAKATRYVTQPSRLGPSALAQATATGVFAAIRAVATRLGHTDVRGLHVAVQGVGEVGARLVAELVAAGARVTIEDADTERCKRIAAAHRGVAMVEHGAILGLDCDVFAPCAFGGVIHDLTLPGFRARAIVGSANNVLSAPEHGERLFAKGVLYAPDFVVNAGALIHGALWHLEGQAPPRERIEAIGARVGAILDRALAENTPPERIAERMAQEAVEHPR